MTALEEVLAEHAQVSGFDELGVWHKYGCACSWTGASSTDHRAHVADAVTAWMTERLQDADVLEAVCEAIALVTGNVDMGETEAALAAVTDALREGA